MEIGKKPEMQQTGTAEQPKTLETTTENLTQPSQMPEESPIKLKVERDILIQSFEKAKEFMRIQKKQIQTLEEEKQIILSDRQRLREEIRKSTVEIQRLTTELSETQKLNQSLQQSNDDLRNRNGLQSRSEQELLEEEIKDVRDQNSKLQIQVNKSSVEAVDEAEEKQTILSDRQRLREEVRKSTVEIQRLTTELSETQKLNQSLQQSNDDLRNRNGLMSRSEQERLEEEIKDVRDRNSKLQIQVNQSSVEAVEQAQQKQEEAEKKVRTIQCQYNKLQENAETMKEKADQKIKSLKQEMKEKTSFWQMAYIIFLVFEMIESTVVQNDLIACIKVPVRVWCRYVEWVIRPSELNIWGEKEYFSTEWSWCLRVMAIIIIVGAVIAGEMFVLKKIEQYRRVWDKYSIRFMVVSLEMIIVSGDVLRRCMPINLVVLFGIINIAVIEIRIYYRRANEIY